LLFLPLSSTCAGSVCSCIVAFEMFI
jgi:hypothetical protein